MKICGCCKKEYSYVEISKMKLFKQFNLKNDFYIYLFDCSCGNTLSIKPEELMRGLIQQQVDNRKILYNKQIEAMRIDSNAYVVLAFVPQDFICCTCRKDLLADDRTRDQAEKGVLITGCPYCHKSYCD